MQEGIESSLGYDFRRDFSNIAGRGLVRYLRECGYDPDAPPDGLDDCWFTAQEYVCGLWRYLKPHQGLAGAGEPWDAKEAEKTAGVYEADMILTRKESGLKEMECGEPDLALYNKMGLGFKFRPKQAPEWYLQIPSVKRANAAQLERERQSDNTTDAALEPNQKVKSAECMFQRIGLLDAKPREYIVKGFIPRNEVCNPFGRPDSFKGVSATQLAVHIAGGVDFLGMHVKQAPTAYFAGERGEQVKRRIKGHIQRLGLPYDLPCYFGGKPIDLLSKPDLDFLIANIGAIESDAGAALSFLAIDTQSRTMGGDENSTRDGAAYARAIEAIRQATEATLWIIAHTGHSEEAQDRPRGSSALLGAYDTFYRHKKEDETHGSIKITIDRDGLGGKEIPFTVELYDTRAVNDDGEPVLVPYLEAAAAPVDFTFRKANAPKPVKATDTEREALRALDKAIKEHGLVTPEGEGKFGPEDQIPDGQITVSGDEWKAAFHKLDRKRERTASSHAFTRASNGLVAKKLVGTYSSRRWPK
jgi:AAA domain